MDKNKEYQIKVSGKPFNMAPWCSEKTNGVMRNAISIFEIILNSEEIPKHTKKDLLFRFSTLFYNGSKLLAFSEGEKWDFEIRDKIFHHGLKGYESVLMNWGYNGFLETSNKLDTLKNIIQLIDESDKLEASEFRRRSYNLLKMNTIQSGAINSFIDILEKITMGNLSWSEAQVTSLKGVKTKLVIEKKEIEDLLTPE